MTSWREKQKAHFVDKNIEYEQDQRIIDWIDSSKKTFVYQEDYFNKHLLLTSNIDEAEQAIVFITDTTRDQLLEQLCKQFVHIPRVCLAINKYILFTYTFNDIEEDYDLALLNFVKSIFKDRSIDYHYVPNVKGDHFNFASPTSQFYIT